MNAVRRINSVIDVVNPKDSKSMVKFDLVKHLLSGGTNQGGFQIPEDIADALTAQGFDLGDLPHIGPSLARVGAIVRIPFTETDNVATSVDFRATTTDPGFLCGEADSTKDNIKNRMVYIHGGRVIVAYDATETAAKRLLNQAGFSLHSKSNTSGGTSYERYEGLPVYDYASEGDRPMQEFKSSIPVYWSEDALEVKALAVDLVGNAQCVLELAMSWHAYKDSSLSRPILSGCGRGVSGKLGLNLAIPFASHLRHAGRISDGIRGFFGR